MNFLKRLFGLSKTPKQGIKDEIPDLEKLLSSEDLNGSVIGLDNYISAFCDYGDSLDKLSNSQKTFFFNQNLEREINNGGFNQFYFNSAGDFAHETIESLKAIGAHKTAEIVKKANDQFPKGIVPSDRAVRQELLEKIEIKANEFWDELDQKFFEYEEDLNSLNMEYVRKNKNQFEIK